MRDLIPPGSPLLMRLRREYRILHKKYEELGDPDPELKAHTPKHKAFKILLGKGYTPEEAVEIWDKLK